MCDCLCLKRRIIYRSAVIRLIRDSPYNQKRNGIQVTCLCNGCPFHLSTISGKRLHKPLLLTLIRNKLVPCHNTAHECVYIRVHPGTALLSQLNQLPICLKGKCIHTWNLSHCVSKTRGIHIMLQRIIRQNNIPDINLCLKGTCYACIHNSLNLIYICQYLCTHGGIDLTNAGTHHHYILPVQSALIKIHSRPGFHLHVCQLFLKPGHFFIHGSNNS